ncbi:hypothetical protein Ct9H90mP12_1840 [bacterium]|nr:MAG: hypothetical protein Ct9H90mP12_1840 [bacterium]
MDYRFFSMLQPLHLQWHFAYLGLLIGYQIRVQNEYPLIGRITSELFIYAGLPSGWTSVARDPVPGPRVDQCPEVLIFIFTLVIQ